MPLVELTTFVELNVKKRLESVDGVGEILLFGARRREVQVLIDPTRLDAYALTTNDVAAALAAQNLELPGGSIEAGSQRLSVRTLGRLQTPEQFADVVVATVGGSPVRVRDIGFVVDGGADPDLGVEPRREPGGVARRPQAERRQHRRPGRRDQEAHGHGGARRCRRPSR